MSQTIETPKSFGRQLFLLAVSVAIVNTGFGIIFPIFPKLLEDIGGGDALDLGFMAAAFGGAYLIGSPIFGNFADRIGKKKIILVGLLGFTLSNIIYIIATDLATLYLARIVEGFFASAILPPAIALTAELSPKENRGRYLGLLGASQTAGIIVGPLLGGILFEGFSFKGFTVEGSLTLPFYASAVIGFIAFVWSFFQLPPSKIKISNKLTLAQEIESKPGVSDRISETLRHQIRVLPKPVHMFFLFTLAEMLSILAWLTIEPGFVFYFYNELLLSPTDFGMFVGAFGIVSVIGQALLGNVSDKVGRKPVMIVGQIMSFFFYYSLLNADSFNSLIVAVLFAGIGSGLRDPAMKAWLSDVTDEENRATVFGIESGIMSSSQIIGPIIGGFLYETQGMIFVFTIAVTINLINILLLTTLRFDSNQSSTKIELQDQMPTATTGN